MADGCRLNFVKWRVHHCKDMACRNVGFGRMVETPVERFEVLANLLRHILCEVNPGGPMLLIHYRRGIT